MWAVRVHDKKDRSRLQTIAARLREVIIANNGCHDPLSTSAACNALPVSQTLALLFACPVRQAGHGCRIPLHISTPGILYLRWACAGAELRQSQNTMRWAAFYCGSQYS